MTGCSRKLREPALAEEGSRTSARAAPDRQHRQPDNAAKCRSVLLAGAAQPVIQVVGVEFGRYIAGVVGLGGTI